ncbi:uncharacterized protein CC84DRAFT_67017 [Paraphaeosphaeria sporulosa]|uniref:Uncharacterized protein n=1 Tax=Paraphaeosphaeria sporulosa TaxID=1460663 RepID=A0A177CX43_9PLEO|nr:uncharacterized protein CC84DRAFT_67017 [Paraphaeosphaeria sporulosa]OAG12093.1 hypothetical protein CC84DRAFT_67017 [Paraphaeosphaeria sporulosa]
MVGQQRALRDGPGGSSDAYDSPSLRGWLIPSGASQRPACASGLVAGRRSHSNGSARCAQPMSQLQLRQRKVCRERYWRLGYGADAGRQWQSRSRGREGCCRVARAGWRACFEARGQVKTEADRPCNAGE